MREVQVQEAEVKVEFIPAHKFIGIWDSSAQNYGQFWSNGHIAMTFAGFWRACLIIRCLGN